MEGVIAGSPSSVPQIDHVEFVDTPAPARPAAGQQQQPAPAPRRMSELGQVTTTATPADAARMMPIEAPPPGQPAQQQQPPAAEGEGEQPPAAPAAVDYQAKYEALLSSSSIPEDLLDRMVEFPNGKDEPIAMLWRDVPGAVLRHKDYTQKTTEVAEMRRQYEHAAAARQGWTQALTGGAPEQRLQALRAVVPEDGIKDLLRAYVESESALMEMPPQMRELYKQRQAEADRAAALERQLQQLQAQQARAYQEQVQREGITAPSIQVVLQTVEQKLPVVLAKYGLEGNDAAYDTAINMLIRAVQGDRDPGGRWTIKPGVPPSDDEIEYAVSVAREQLTSLAQRFTRAQPARPAAPVPSGGGPALPPGAPGSPGQQQPRRFSELGKRTF
jgi:hypothetical protein